MLIYTQTKKITHNVKDFDRKNKSVCQTRCLPKTQPFEPFDRKKKNLSFVPSPKSLQGLLQENVSLTFLFYHQWPLSFNCFLRQKHYFLLLFTFQWSYSNSSFLRSKWFANNFLTQMTICLKILRLRALLIFLFKFAHYTFEYLNQKKVSFMRNCN